MSSFSEWRTRRFHGTCRLKHSTNPHLRCCHSGRRLREIHTDPEVCSQPAAGEIHTPVPVRFKAYTALVL